jgi:DNA modification methylase
VTGPITLSRRDLFDQRPDGASDDVHFPEALAAAIIGSYSNVGDLVLDPFAGFGTTAVVALRFGRGAVAVELLPERAAIIRQLLGDLGRVVTGDARELTALVQAPIDLCLTSPPYMTRLGHPENPMTGYRTLDGAYETYLDDIESVGREVASLLRPSSFLVVNVATIISEGTVTELARDVGARLARHLARLADVPIVWDEAPPGILDDRCLVFQPVQSARSNDTPET